ncbi:MAG TPA: bifunctional phosphoribosyl-AMP cyclohydrolase/phosphoribosyl-ATP diphosphatase HisIE [Brevundimonas sp.]|uniref:bifunctional phosphoribosyl-AMP cyclohydrolase/phosphoribosyl-ATP diphosphatase HisIE n=1 Tax=Brevundimonas sp. TaxID=1871086 RepID=UPI00261537F7|nr:bifunctional phosphoribosyl-AMP cyclohydrolase/phosphoribosyl-ATP diphosphatase HisIE [Brevundimonas sp.]HRO33851.1 bifunctional phosphoribosyl-AMP cyclohydrolase/phosphoribosyl-ATP diphosphatase HisIE [Brevundimonas sp.]
MIDPETLDFRKGDGLVPVVVQDADTLQVLILAYADRAAVEETIASGEATFFSRSRGGRWRKGETSGNRLAFVDLIADCDGDALLMTVRPTGPACHLGRTSCFGDATAPGVGRLALLERTIAARAQCSDPGSSYTATLLAQGIKRIAQKVGEEGVETALAAVAGSDQELAEEAADLMYHLYVLLRCRGMAAGQMFNVLKRRDAA